MSTLFYFINICTLSITYILCSNDLDWNRKIRLGYNSHFCLAFNCVRKSTLYFGARVDL